MSGLSEYQRNGNCVSDAVIVGSQKSIMENQYFYTTEIEWIGERRADLSAPNLPALVVDAPPEFKGHEGFWTPEHLFVASLNSCYMTTFVAIAENSKFDFVRLGISATGKLENTDGHGLMITEITLQPRLVVRDARNVERALRILQKAEKNCLIANSMRSQITLEPEITVAEYAESGPDLYPTGTSTSVINVQTP